MLLFYYLKTPCTLKNVLYLVLITMFVTCQFDQSPAGCFSVKTQESFLVWA